VGLSTNLDDSEQKTKEMIKVNEHFIQAELEYRRQQRLAAAAEYRRARSAARTNRARSRLADVIDRLAPTRIRDRAQPIAEDHGCTASAA
jgi:hypothetical protein